MDPRQTNSVDTSSAKPVSQKAYEINFARLEVSASDTSAATRKSMQMQWRHLYGLILLVTIAIIAIIAAASYFKLGPVSGPALYVLSGSSTVTVLVRALLGRSKK